MFNLVLVLISVRLDMSRVRRGHLCFGRCVAHAVDTIGYVGLKDPPPPGLQKTPLGTKSRRTHGLF